MSEKPNWIRTASDHAVISREELREWLQLKSEKQIPLLIDSQGLPKPRFLGKGRQGKGISSYITKNARWRVGDIRAWLSGNELRQRAETTTRVGSTATNPNHPWRDDWDKKTVPNPSVSTV